MRNSEDLAAPGESVVRDFLQRNGWSLQRVQGSHHIFAKPGSRVRVSVPIHGNRPLKVGLQSYLMKLANLTPGD